MVASDDKSKVDALLDKSKNRFTNSKSFKEYVGTAFKAVDADGSGNLDVDEVYIAVLMLYLKINGFCKNAVPPTRHQVEDLFLQFNYDDDPNMDLEEFEGFCAVLCSQILTRVLVQFLLQTAVAPLLGLLALEVWSRIAKHYAPETFLWCDSHIPTPLVVTAVVGTAISLLVPPMMKLVDKYIITEGFVVKCAACKGTGKSGGWLGGQCPDCLGAGVKKLENKDEASLKGRAIAKMRALKADPNAFLVGEKIQMMDKGDAQWFDGYVTSVDPLKVRYETGTDGYTFHYVQHMEEEGGGGMCCVGR